jgi:hypothetical protein
VTSSFFFSTPDSPCGAGVGLCLNNRTNFGDSNAYLELDGSGLLSLTYSGPPCPYQPAANTQAKINFICPPRYARGPDFQSFSARYSSLIFSPSCLETLV